MSAKQIRYLSVLQHSPVSRPQHGHMKATGQGHCLISTEARIQMMRLHWPSPTPTPTPNSKWLVWKVGNLQKYMAQESPSENLVHIISGDSEGVYDVPCITVTLHGQPLNARGAEGSPVYIRPVPGRSPGSITEISQYSHSAPASARATIMQLKELCAKMWVQCLLLFFYKIKNWRTSVLFVGLLIPVLDFGDVCPGFLKPGAIVSGKSSDIHIVAFINRLIKMWFVVYCCSFSSSILVHVFIVNWHLSKVSALN